MVSTSPPSTYSATGNVNEQIVGYFSEAPHSTAEPLGHWVRPDSEPRNSNSD